MTDFLREFLSDPILGNPIMWALWLFGGLYVLVGILNRSAEQRRREKEKEELRKFLSDPKTTKVAQRAQEIVKANQGLQDRKPVSTNSSP